MTATRAADAGAADAEHFARRPRSTSRSSSAGAETSSLLLHAASAFVCVATCAVLYARDTYEDAAGHGTDGGFFGALAVAAVLFAVATSAAHDHVVDAPTRSLVSYLARRGIVVRDGGADGGADGSADGGADWGAAASTRALAETDAVLVDEKVARVGPTGASLRAVHVTQTGVSPKDVLVAAALSTRWSEPPTSAVDAAVLGSVDVEPLSDSYEQVDHATEGGDSLTGGDSLGVGWIATSTLVRKSDGGSAFRTCVGSVDAVLTRCRSGWADVDDAARRVGECAAAGALCVAVAADYRGRSDDDGEDDGEDEGEDDGAGDAFSDGSEGV